MSSFLPARRDFLQILGGTAGAAWFTAQWPAIVSAAQHAHDAAKASMAAKYEVLTVEQARELDALTSCIIPTTDTPGAREAGVVYFIDRALKTFASESVPQYNQGLAGIQQFTLGSFPGVLRFSAANAEQQKRILTELYAEIDLKKDMPRRGLPPTTTEFLQTLHVHTIFGFLVDPEGGGNRDFAGWKVVDRDPAHMFSPPFGFYDKDYPGWQASSIETGKK
jgi:gluconate 2-dehydrogenase gamma chain